MAGLSVLQKPQPRGSTDRSPNPASAPSTPSPRPFEPFASPRHADLGSSSDRGPQPGRCDPEQFQAKAPWAVCGVGGSRWRGGFVSEAGWGVRSSSGRELVRGEEAGRRRPTDSTGADVTGSKHGLGACEMSKRPSREGRGRLASATVAVAPILSLSGGRIGAARLQKPTPKNCQLSAGHKLTGHPSAKLSPPAPGPHHAFPSPPLF